MNKNTKFICPKCTSEQGIAGKAIEAGTFSSITMIEN